MIRSGEISPVEVIEAHLARIRATEPVLNSFITVLPDEAIAAARQAERDIRAGRYRGPLHGIPVGLKDLFNTGGVRTTSGSRIYDNYIPAEDCTVAARFREAGAILLGKLNMHQFAYGPTGENPDYGHMHNPWDPERVSGGSSGGSGSAAASGQATITMGTDTGGSVRIPSALCGLAGLKPTFGRLSKYGLNPLSWTLDHPGPMCRTVEDCALAMNAIAGYDPRDPSSANVPVPDFTSALTGDVRGLRVGLPSEYFDVPVDSQVEAAVRSAVNVLGEMGATVKEVSWPTYLDSAAISTVILLGEAAAAHRDTVVTRGAEIYPPARLRLEAGMFFSAADFLRAQRGRTLLEQETRALLRDVDVLIGPSVPIVAHKIGATSVQIGDRTVGSVPALTQYSRPFNVNGYPSMSVPCGFSEDGLPIGLQIAGRPFDEETVLRVGHAYERATDWHTKRPAL
jgi:aspartyl-tRNA(Asn)/glutamyl-tRNA(Gln) amidotransferase subunit A